MFLQVVFNSILFIISLFGILLNHRSILIVLICIELVLLSINLNFIVFAMYLNDLVGQVFSLFILTVAAAESAIGLAVLILYYRIRGNIYIDSSAVLKG